MAFIVTFDGPKGVGKTTLIHQSEQRLCALGRRVQVLTEKELMTAVLGTKVDAAYKLLKSAPGPASDLALAELHRQGRILITNAYLRNNPAEVVLLDRWFPSDAVFRRHIDVSAAIEENLRAGVHAPNLAFAVICDPQVSWERANQRERQLDSKVISNYEDHIASTERFGRIAQDRGWHLLRSDEASAHHLSSQVVDEIESSLSGRMVRAIDL